MRGKKILAAFLIGSCAAVSFGQVDSQYPLSILWPTVQGNHKIGSEDSSRPIKFVNITNIEIGHPYNSYFSGTNVVKHQIISAPQNATAAHPEYGIGRIPDGFHNGQLDADTVAVCHRMRL